MGSLLKGLLRSYESLRHTSGFERIHAWRGGAAPSGDLHQTDWARCSKLTFPSGHNPISCVPVGKHQPMSFCSDRERLWIEADAEEIRGEKAGIIITGGTRMIKLTAPRAVLLRLRSQPTAYSKKLIQSTREFVTSSFFNHSPFLMLPTFASGWMRFRFKGELPWMSSL